MPRTENGAAGAVYAFGIGEDIIAMINRLHRWFGNGWMGIAELLITAFCVFFSLSVHEFAHGFAAYKLGDGTAKAMGRLNLSPSSHLDPIGAICLFLFGFGWAKPVPINPANFRRDRMKSGMVITALAGPLGNLITAFAAILIMRIVSVVYGNAGGILAIAVTVVNTLLYVLGYMNIGLAVFNLIPIPPLDGSKVLSAVLPARTYFHLMQYERYGFIILILLINTPVFGNLLYGLQSIIWSFYNWVIGLLPFL